MLGKRNFDLVDFVETYEGEYPFTGYHVTMIRFTHCNLTCPWCDTDFSSPKVTVPIEEIIRSVNKTGNLMITGGEPGLHSSSIIEICNKLLQDSSNYVNNIYVQTNGLIFRSSIDRILKIDYKFDDFYYIWSPKFYDDNVTRQSLTYLMTLEQYIDLDSLYIKIVVDEDVLDKIDLFITKIDELYGKKLLSNTSLMPKTSENNITGNSKLTFELCNKYMVHFSPRIHLVYNLT